MATKKIYKQIDLSTLSGLTTSAKIRTLWGQGFDKATIAHNLGIRYQHVRNVLLQTNKKSEVVKAGSDVVSVAA